MLGRGMVGQGMVGQRIIRKVIPLAGAHNQLQIQMTPQKMTPLPAQAVEWLPDEFTCNFRMALEWLPYEFGRGVGRGLHALVVHVSHAQH